MNKEQLTDLGLTDEQADAVIKGFGQMVPKSRLDDKITEINNFKVQLADRDTQLEELKQVDAEGLQTKITELQTANEAIKTDFEQQLKQRDFDFAVETALRDASAKNPRAVRALLDVATIQLTDGKLIGLDEQLHVLKASDDYLFGGAEGLKGKTPPSPNGKSKTTVTKEQFANMGYQERSQLYTTDPELYKQLTNN